MLAETLDTSILRYFCSKNYKKIISEVLFNINVAGFLQNSHS